LRDGRDNHLIFMERNYPKRIEPNKCTVFFDFDNTVVTRDVFDDLVLRFSRNNRWRDLEEKWKRGEIGSKECLSGQLKGVNITRQALNKYLSSINLDPCFKKLVKLLKRKKIKTVILSDNFDYLLQRILKENRIKNLKVLANKLQLSHNRLIPRFPFEDGSCRLCAHCKTKNLLANARRNSIIIYIGDGRSDICPAQYSDIVFAKEALLDYYRKKKLTCFAYQGLEDVYNFLRRRLR